MQLLMNSHCIAHIHHFWASALSSCATTSKPTTYRMYAVTTELGLCGMPLASAEHAIRACLPQVIIFSLKHTLRLYISPPSRACAPQLNVPQFSTWHAITTEHALSNMYFTTEPWFQTTLATAIELVLWSMHPGTSVNDPSQKYWTCLGGTWKMHLIPIESEFWSILPVTTELCCMAGGLELLSLH